MGGYWDQEDMWGTQAEYAALKQHDTTHEVFLVLGPWNHGGWAGKAAAGVEFGRLDFGEATGIEFRKTMEAPFFEKYLKDRPGFDLADTASFRTGVDKWERYAQWPPASGFSPAKLYLEPGRKLSFAQTANAGGWDRGRNIRRTRRTRYPIATGRSSRPMRQDPDGTRGWSRTSAL